jgi:hypothetical protein
MTLRNVAFSKNQRRRENEGVKKYQVYVHKTITEYWTIEAETEADARMFYDVNGTQTGEKENEREVDVYED